LGGSLEALKLDSTLFFPGPPPTSVRVDVPAILWVASVEFAAHDLHLVAEYGRWHVGLNSSDPTLFPETFTVSERGYVMATYRLRSWLQPGIYYSMLYPNVDVRTGRSAQQHDLALTFRFDVNPHWLIKLEAHYMNGTAGLSSSLNDNRPLHTLARDWAVFLAKTSVYF
jgi:hypothetical protein